MSDTLRLESNGRSIDLYSWLNNKVKGHEALAGIVGFGLPGVTNQWFSGAGSTSTHRGSRISRRVINLPLKVYASNRQELNELLSDLSIILDPFVPRPDGYRGAARLFFGMPDDFEWYVDVVRSGGGDWSRKTDSDDRTYFKTTLQLEAGDAFWTRNEPEHFDVKVADPGPPTALLPRIARLRVRNTDSTAQGIREMVNSGDAAAYPTFTLHGPATFVGFYGPRTFVPHSSTVEAFSWVGELAAGETLTIDMREHTVEDQAGNNRYEGVEVAPHFFAVSPGRSTMAVFVEGATPATLLTAQWRPKRWAVV
ncbi:hypothetical protein ACTJKK_02425 [Microbacterium sp. 22179]|uniref:hypothetical protein n=1 Tax=Microbacterium sp. 22179 TaxID=3453886 RepID=UPI003F8258D1